MIPVLDEKFVKRLSRQFVQR